MLNIEGIDFELPQINKTPKMGYSEEFIEKTMISGKKKRIYKGRRFSAVFSYAVLTEDQINTFNELLELQRQQGYLNVELSSPFGTYAGGATIDIDEQQTRFKINRQTGAATWANWQLTLKAIDLEL